jgi:hypothetical protein
VEEPKTPTTSEEGEIEDVEAHGNLDRPSQDEREGNLDEPDVEAHGLLDRPSVDRPSQD